MRQFDKRLEHVGGACLAIAILLGVIAALRPVWGDPGAQGPGPILALQSAVGLAFLGILLLALSRMLARHAMQRVLVLPDGSLVLPDSEADTPRPAMPQRAPQRRVCLKPVWPLRTTRNWVGGLPHLPPDTPWPELHGRPASFLAQIALDDLPETLWQGIGPRTGWLVFFGDGETDHHAVVLHVTGPVAPRQQPEGVRHAWDLGTEPDAMHHLIGTVANVPPQWYLQIADQSTLGAVEDMAQKSDPASDEGDHWDSTQGRWVWQTPRPLSRRTIVSCASHPNIRNGTTWATAFAILAGLRTTLEEQARSTQNAILNQPAMLDRLDARIAELKQTSRGSDAAALAAQKTLPHQQSLRDRCDTDHPRNLEAAELLSARLDQVATLENELKATSEQADYQPVLGAELHKLVEAMDAELSATANISLSRFDTIFASLMEHHARLRYTQDPDSLPPELFELYAPLWQQECDDTAIFLGTNATLPQTGLDRHTPGSWWARLLDMPANPLTGITIGDDSRFYVDILAQDLNAGDLTAVHASNTHGHL